MDNLVDEFMKDLGLNGYEGWPAWAQEMAQRMIDAGWSKNDKSGRV